MLAKPSATLRVDQLCFRTVSYFSSIWSSQSTLSSILRASWLMLGFNGSKQSTHKISKKQSLVGIWKTLAVIMISDTGSLFVIIASVVEIKRLKTCMYYIEEIKERRQLIPRALWSPGFLVRHTQLLLLLFSFLNFYWWRLRWLRTHLLMQEMLVWSLGQEDALEDKMASPL